MKLPASRRGRFSLCFFLKKISQNSVFLCFAVYWLAGVLFENFTGIPRKKPFFLNEFPPNTSIEMDKTKCFLFAYFDGGICALAKNDCKKQGHHRPKIISNQRCPK
jgi:hypothetical protein